MGLLSKLFGNKKQPGQDMPTEKELLLEFDVMNNIQLETCRKYEDTNRYKFIENGIYEDLEDTDAAKYRMVMSYELETTEDKQYPLEDILEEYLIHVSDPLEDENDVDSVKFKFEFGGELEDLKNAQHIIGKKVFNREFKGANGEILVGFVIE